MAGGSVVKGVLCLAAAWALWRFAVLQLPGGSARPADQVVTASATPPLQAEAAVPQADPTAAIFAAAARMGGQGAAIAAQAPRSAVAVVASGQPWNGPAWRGGHRRTPFDRLFKPTAEDRQALESALAELSYVSMAANECDLRSIRWGLIVGHHVTEITENPATLLGDPRGFVAVQQARQDAAERMLDGLNQELKTDERSVCLALAGSPELKDADDIEQRRLHRKHELWEGAGGH